MIATVIVALITAIAAIIAPIITQWIAQKGAYKLKSFELFFAEKVHAYTAFIAASSEYPIDPGLGRAFTFQKALNQAVLLSSEETGKVLKKYYSCLLDLDKSSKDELDKARANALQAMQKELNKYQK